MKYKDDPIYIESPNSKLSIDINVYGMKKLNTQ